MKRKVTAAVGLQISEQEYRDLPFPSYSLLSDIAKVGNVAVGGERNKDIGDLDSVIYGKIVDSLFTEGIEPVGLRIVDKKPSGKAIDLIKAIVKNKHLLVNPDNVLDKANHDLIASACELYGYFKSRSARIKGLENYADYINTLSALKEGEFITTKYIYWDAKKASRVISEYFDDFISSDIGKNYEIVPQVKIVGEVEGVKVKGMLDFILINHDNKEIFAFDLKTGSYDFKEFLIKGVIGWNYYIQACVYYILLKEELSKHPVYHDYKLDDKFRFLYYGKYQKIPWIYNLHHPTDYLIDTKNTHGDTALLGVKTLLDIYSKTIEDNSAET